MFQKMNINDRWGSGQSSAGREVSVAKHQVVNLFIFFPFCLFVLLYFGFLLAFFFAFHKKIGSSQFFFFFNFISPPKNISNCISLILLEAFLKLITSEFLFQQRKKQCRYDNGAGGGGVDNFGLLSSLCFYAANRLRRVLGQYQHVCSKKIVDCSLGPQQLQHSSLRVLCECGMRARVRYRIFVTALSCNRRCLQSDPPPLFFSNKTFQ